MLQSPLSFRNAWCLAPPLRLQGLIGLGRGLGLRIFERLPRWFKCAALLNVEGLDGDQESSRQ